MLSGGEERGELHDTGWHYRDKIGGFSELRQIDGDNLQRQRGGVARRQNRLEQPDLRPRSGEVQHGNDEIIIEKAAVRLLLT